MQNYKEAEVAGTKHTRARFIGLVNEYGKEAVVNFHEEIVHNVGDTKIHKDVGVLSARIDMNKTITDEDGNTCTYADLYKWMAIAYFTEAASRDARDAQAVKDVAYLEFIQSILMEVTNVTEQQVRQLINVEQFEAGMSVNDAVAIVIDATTETETGVTV